MNIGLGRVNGKDVFFSLPNKVQGPVSFVEYIQRTAWVPVLIRDMRDRLSSSGTFVATAHMTFIEYIGEIGEQEECDMCGEPLNANTSYHYHERCAH